MCVVSCLHQMHSKKVCFCIVEVCVGICQGVSDATLYLRKTYFEEWIFISKFLHYAIVFWDKIPDKNHLQLLSLVFFGFVLEDRADTKLKFEIVTENRDRDMQYTLPSFINTCEKSSYSRLLNLRCVCFCYICCHHSFDSLLIPPHFALCSRQANWNLFS